MKAHGQELTRHELARRSGDMTALGGVRTVILDDGSERGVRVIEFRTGSGLAFDILVDRAMDIGAAEHAGLVTQLKAAQTAFDETELKAKPLTELRKLAQMAKVEAPRDFSARGVAVPRAASGQDFTPPNPYDTPIKALQAVN